MDWRFSDLITYFSSEDTRGLLLKGKWGIEKESLRVKEDGSLAMTPHPAVFRDKGFYPNVITDFSESQLEIITPPSDSIEKMYFFLEALNTKVVQAISDELLWPQSMPGPLPAEAAIPIARFDNSEKGRLKEIYRSGLALRYGKKVQMISGIHYNFSFHDVFWTAMMDALHVSSDRQAFINDASCALVRNVLRYRWLLIYLFGASPVADETYHTKVAPAVNDKDCFKTLDSGFEFCTRNATSLRMSRFGYENAMNSRLLVSYNSLGDYIRDIRTILSTKNDDYAKLGIFKNGKQIQLNDNQLQLENEFYSPVRFKQIPGDNETQLDALEKRGVKYLEIRAFDINPFEKNGISLEQLCFTHVFILFCLFEQSPLFTGDEFDLMNLNAHKMSLMGRIEGVRLHDAGGKSHSVPAWGTSVIEKLRIIAELLDKKSGKTLYADSVEHEYQKLVDKSLLPSSRILEEMKQKKETYLEFNLRRARENRVKGFVSHVA
jgi:glutamate--cysteine ligase